MRVVLIHALRHSQAPIEAAFAEFWPDAKLINLVDDSLSADLVRQGALSEDIASRFLVLGRYAASLRPDAILFTCSAFGPCIEAVRVDLSPLPVRRPNEAVISEAAAIGGRMAVVATFAPTLDTIISEFPSTLEIDPIYVAGALQALDAGEAETHDTLVVEALAGRSFDFVVLAQYSLARAAKTVVAAYGVPVLTAPSAAVKELRRTLQSQL